MSKKLYPEEDIQNIANAIRNLNGSSDTYTVSEMASAITLPENGYYLKESASANPLSITDGEELNAQSCEVSFEPIQDLNGYDSPWIDSDVINKEPYLMRAVSGTATRIGNSLYDTLVGGTVVWNQLVNYSLSSFSIGNVSFTKNNDGTYTVNGTNETNATSNIVNISCVVGHKYLMGLAGNSNVKSYDYQRDSLAQAKKGLYINNGRANNIVFRLVIEGGVTYNNEKIGLICSDLTAMFGSTIADYIYSLEQATRGSGVAYFRSLFPKDYYDYNAGQLMSVKALSHKMVGFNQWDEEWERGLYNTTTGEKASSNSTIRNKNLISVMPNTTYYWTFPSSYGAYMRMLFYDANKNYIGFRTPLRNSTIVTPSNAKYIAFYGDGTTYKNDICINLHWDGERDGEYEAYEEHIYPLDSDLELRGIPKLDANNKLYYDGDTYESDGTVTRKYAVVDLGTLNWAKINDENYPNRFSTSISGIGTNMICVGYIFNGVGGYGSAIAEDKTFVVNNQNLFFHDSAYTDATAFKTAMSGVYLVYELATPTTETADTFQNPQLVDNWGTEEYTDSREVQIPVGHETYHANICPIVGHNNISVTVNGTAKTTNFSNTIYGGNADIVNGEGQSEWGYIASYNGETLSDIWISDRDAYEEGTTPTTGAEVVYKLATATDITFTETAIPIEDGNNTFSTDGDSVQLKYFSKSLS